MPYVMIMMSNNSSVLPSKFPASNPSSSTSSSDLSTFGLIILVVVVFVIIVIIVAYLFATGVCNSCLIAPHNDPLGPIYPHAAVQMVSHDEVIDVVVDIFYEETQ